MFTDSVRILRDDPANFSVDASSLGVVCTVGALSSRVVLRGELDAVSAPALDLVVDWALVSGPPRLEIDLAELGFLGVAGIRAFQRADRRFAGLGGRVVLERPSPYARKMLDLVDGGRLLG